METKVKKINDLIESLPIDNNTKVLIYEYIEKMEDSDLRENLEINLNKWIKLSNKYPKKTIQYFWQLVCSEQYLLMKETDEREKKLRIISDKLKIKTNYKNESLNFKFIQKNEEDEDAMKDLILAQKERIKNEKIEIKCEVKDILKEIEKLNNKIHYLNEKIEKIENENNELKEIIYSESTSYESKTKIQKIPIEIYLDTNNSKIIFGVYEAVLSFIENIGFEKVFEFKHIKGSWFKRMIVKSKIALSPDEVFDKLKEVEYGIEVNTILKHQSEIDKNQSEALLNILKSVENVPNAAIRIGSLLVVKLTTKKGDVNVQVRSLSIKELHLLNKKPELLHNPQKIFIALTLEIKEEGELPETSQN